MSVTETLIQESFEKGQKLSEYSFIQAGGKRYNYRNYVIGFNKLQRSADQIKFDSSALVQTLKEQTESLRIKYLARIEEYARKEFKGLEKLAASAYPSQEGFVKRMQGPTLDGRNLQAVTHYYDREGFKAHDRAVNARRMAQNIVEAGLEAHLAKNEKMAENHYQDSILRLANRIEKKNMDQANLSIQTAWIGQNIETIFTDGVQTVKAWTIIAEGPIQKPHYRYLVK